jgi:para-nitrobenzyl esterase
MLRKTIVENGAVQGIPCGDPRITVYKGIPYAKPPVGDLRWKVPQIMENWDGMFIADRFAPMALQGKPGLDWSEFYTKEIHPASFDYQMSEDCLYLNVWTPARDASERFPVFYYIHGGGYVGGYSYEMEFDGERVARHGCVMVTVGYRLGAMGFFSHKDLSEECPNESQGNYGFLDQAAGLKWVKRNIASFGGDPERITIGGQSAGAGSVFALMCSPLTKGLFSGALLMSGGGLRDNIACNLEEAQADGDELLKALDVKTVKEARGLPGEIVSTTFTSLRNHSPTRRRTAIVIDNVFMKENPYDIVMNNKLPELSFLIGYCRGEGGFLRRVQQYPITPKDFEEFIRKEFGKYADRYLALAKVQSADDLEEHYKDDAYNGFALGQIPFAKILAEQGRPVYMYLFDHEMPGDSAGSYHGSDMWFIFDSLNRCWRPFTGRHYDLARKVCTYFVNFYASGNPNGIDHDGQSLPKWDKFTMDTPMRMVFTNVPAQTEISPESEIFKMRVDRMLGRLTH